MYEVLYYFIQKIQYGKRFQKIKANFFVLTIRGMGEKKTNVIFSSKFEKLYAYLINLG